jgi:hypothetical protein
MLLHLAALMDHYFSMVIAMMPTHVLGFTGFGDKSSLLLSHG